MERDVSPNSILATASAGEETMIRTGCPSHNCGGRCLLRVWVRDNVITRIETDDRPGDTVADPQLRACMRGRAYRRRQHHEDRLKYPLRRVGGRGSGQFERIAWDEATGLVAANIKRIREQYGNTSLFVPYGTGSYNQTGGKRPADRLMNLYGGCLGIYNSYSWAAITRPRPPSTARCHRQSAPGLAQQPLHPDVGLEPGRNARRHQLRLLRQAGPPEWRHSGLHRPAPLAHRGCPGRRVDPHPPRHRRRHDERHGLRHADRRTLRLPTLSARIAVGWDATQMPAWTTARVYSDYLLGMRDGHPKTPEWAEPITAIPAATITRIAREYATAQAGVLYQGYGMQRRAYGEQVVRAGCVLAAITGNVGVPGGWASGLALQARRRPALERLPDPGKSGQGTHPGLSLVRGGAARTGAAPKRMAWSASSACATTSS